MDKLKLFFTTSILGGLAVILPVAILFFVFSWVFGMVTDLIDPLTSILFGKSELKPLLADIIVLGIVLCVFFLVGVFVKTQVGKYVFNFVEKTIFHSAPGYKMVKETVLQLMGSKKSLFSTVALAQIFENKTLVTCFVTEEHPDGSFSVFVPTAPNPTSGFVYHLRGKYVHPINVAVDDAMRTVLSCGAGSTKLVEAYKNKVK